MAKSTQSRITAPNNQLTLLSIALLHVDAFYQRPVITRHVNNIVRAFDPRLLTPPIVAKRPDGTYWIIDGQQRIEALRRLGYTNVYAMVVEVGSTIEEAELFVRVNTSAKALVTRDNYKACVYRQTNVAVEIESTLNRHGLTALLADSRDEVTALSKVLEAWGPSTPVYQHFDLGDSDQRARFQEGKRALTWLVESLSPLINRGFTAKSVYHGNVVGGMLWLARAHDDIELEKVQAALSRIRTPEELRFIASQVRTSAGGSRRNLYGARLAHWMNQQGAPFIALTVDEWSVLQKFDPYIDLANDPAVIVA